MECGEASQQGIRRCWELLAAASPYPSHAPLGDPMLHPQSQQCQMVIHGLIKEFVDNASFSIRTPNHASRSQAFGERISFESFVDARLILEALAAAIRLQLLPGCASSAAAGDGQDSDAIPLLVAMGSVVLDEAERLGHRSTLSGAADVLRCLSTSGYAESVLTMLSQKDPLYTGVSIARKYRKSLSFITCEIADLIEVVNSKIILNGIFLALEGLVESPLYWKTLGTTQATDKEFNLGRYEIDMLHHASEVLKIPLSLRKSIHNTSEVAEFLTRAEIFLKITIIVVKEGSWLYMHDPHRKMINELALCCAALASAERNEDVPLSWTTREVRLLAADVVYGMSEAFYGKRVDQSQSKPTMSNFGCDGGYCENFMLDFLPIVLPVLKREMENDLKFDDKETTYDNPSVKITEDSAAVAAHQMFWCLKQVSHPHLGILSSIIMPCVLTALNHYSPDVKRQAMKTFMHLINNLNVTELRWYKDIILDCVTRSLVGCGELWPIFVEGAIVLATCMEGKNARGKWYHRTLDEMLGELERQQFDIVHCKIWLQHCGKLFEHMGLVLVAHFRRLLPLLFSWLHMADDSICLLALQNLTVIIKHTWPRMPYHSGRFWKELVLVYKESGSRQLMSDIRAAVIDVSLLLKLCGGNSFGLEWKKYQDDTALDPLISALVGTNGHAPSCTLSE